MVLCCPTIQPSVGMFVLFSPRTDLKHIWRDGTYVPGTPQFQFYPKLFLPHVFSITIVPVLVSSIPAFAFSSSENIWNILHCFSLSLLVIDFIPDVERTEKRRVTWRQLTEHIDRINSISYPSQQQLQQTMVTERRNLSFHCNLYEAKRGYKCLQRYHLPFGVSKEIPWSCTWD